MDDPHIPRGMSTIGQIITLAMLLIVLGGAYLLTRDLPPSIPDDLDVSADWLTATDEERGYTFKYPATFGTGYISTADWPPVVTLYDQVFSCVPAGLENGRAGITELRTISGRHYCVTRENEGAAGSTYTSYAYATQNRNLLAIFTFSLRTPQCLNYDDPRRTECSREVAAFDPDLTVDRMAQTLKTQF